MAQADEFFTLKGHGGPVMGIAVSTSSGQVATASVDNSVGLWQTQKPEWLEGHRAAVNAVAFVDEARLVSADDDFALIDWDLSTRKGALRGTHQAKITALAVSPSGGVVASANWDGSIGLWADGGSPPQFLSGHKAGVNTVSFNSDGTRLYSDSADGTIRVGDVATATEYQLLLSHGFGVNEIVLDTAAGWLAYGALDGSTRIVDITNGTPLRDFSLEYRPILAMAYDPLRQQLAVGDGEGFIMLIDTAAWRIKRDFRAAARGPIWALAFSPDGTNIHAGGPDNVMYFTARCDDGRLWSHVHSRAVFSGRPDNCAKRRTTVQTQMLDLSHDKPWICPKGRPDTL
ncbi:MAG: cytochrome c [Paracoccaceae bacterium]|jgi:cytochrome c